MSRRKVGSVLARHVRSHGNVAVFLLPAQFAGYMRQAGVRPNSALREADLNEFGKATRLEVIQDVTTIQGEPAPGRSVPGTSGFCPPSKVARAPRSEALASSRLGELPMAYEMICRSKRSITGERYSFLSPTLNSVTSVTTSHSGRRHQTPGSAGSGQQRPVRPGKSCSAFYAGPCRPAAATASASERSSSRSSRPT